MNIYTVDVFASKDASWMSRNVSPECVSGPYGTYYSFRHVSSDEASVIEKKAKRYHIRTRRYEDRWSRSEDYRRTYLDSVRGRKICPYCGRPIRGRLDVDHIVPVGRLKKPSFARTLLTMRGIDDANDLRNLAAAHPECNRRKSDRLGIWYLRGLYGTDERYWKFENTVKAMLFIALVGAVFYVSSVMLGIRL